MRFEKNVNLHKLTVIFIPVLLALTGCNEQSTSADSKTIVATAANSDDSKKGNDFPVTIDLSSPDRTLKTHFAFQDRNFRLAYQELLEPPKEGSKHRVKQAAVLFDGAAKNYAERILLDKPSTDTPVLEQYERDIRKIENETETRAVAIVWMRNITPIPVGAEPTNFDKERRSEGSEYKFVLGKTSEGWKIEDIQEFDLAPPDYSKKVWTRISTISFFNDTRPRVSSLVDPLY